MLFLHKYKKELRNSVKYMVKHKNNGKNLYKFCKKGTYYILVIEKRIIFYDLLIEIKYKI